MKKACSRSGWSWVTLKMKVVSVAVVKW